MHPVEVPSLSEITVRYSILPVDASNKDGSSRKRDKKVDRVNVIRHELRGYFNRQGGPVNAQTQKRENW